MRLSLEMVVLVCAGTAVAEPKFLILDEDNDHYFKGPTEWMDEAHLNAYVDLLADGGKVTHVFFCPTGGRASFDSKTWEPIWNGLDEQPKDEIFFLFRRWSENAKALCEKGIDPYRVWIRRCREKGISPWLSPRMNDAHDGAAWGSRKPYRNTTFWRTRKDLRCYPDYEKGSWRHHQLDYSKREVRENALAMIRELFERYDFDGLNLHANRWFPDETARANIPVMTAFVREVRRIADAWEKRRGHKIGLSVCRAGFTPDDCRGRGFDAAAMAKEGLLDIIVCQPDSEPHFGETLDVGAWRREIGDAKAAIVAGRGERLFQGRNRHDRRELDWMNFTAEMFRGWADQQAAAGADGFYLFNVEYQPKDQFEICRTGLMAGDISNRSRSYPCLTNCLPVRLDMPRQFAFNVGLTTEGVVSALVGFSGADAPNLAGVALNGVMPLTNAVERLQRENFNEVRQGGERYLALDCPARRFVFPASAVRTGKNILSFGASNPAVVQYVELRIDPKQSLPKVWMSYSQAVKQDNFEMCAADCKAHGVDVVEAPRSHKVGECRVALDVCRRLGLKMFTSIRDASRSDAKPDARGAFEPAVMIGGVYRGKAIDRNLFSFAAKRHEIVLEPPVYAAHQPYLRSPHYIARGDGHYYDGYVPTGRAEIVVPERLFDGRQHLKIIPAKVELAQRDVPVENDTATKLTMTDSIRNRKLVKLSFDLTGLKGCRLDKVGIAVYWRMATEGLEFNSMRGAYSMFAPTTRERERDFAREEIALWEKANGGTFPADVVIAARLGDESFYINGWSGDNRQVNFPIWDCAPSALCAFQERCPGLAFPRTWGAPEVYGCESAAKFLFLFHRAAADFLRGAAEEFHRVGVKVFRNTTRAHVWSYVNDHDGTGQELLAGVLDYLHCDPYPRGPKGYDDRRIPFDLSYFGGLSRRFGKPVIVWMQAHEFQAVGLTHSSADDVWRMYGQVVQQAPDAIMWLGYCPKGGATFPVKNPGAWEAAKKVHKNFHQSVVRTSDRVGLAVDRDYENRARSLGFGTSADERLGQRLCDLSANGGGRYDIFETSPFLSETDRAKLDFELSAYREVARARMSAINLGKLYFLKNPGNRR